MKCPKCGGKLETKEHESLSVECCNGCHGLLVRQSMLYKMLAGQFTEVFLDVGDASQGKKFDKIDEIDCPVCKIEMQKIVDPVQTHIWMESCPKCLRVFLDAGEFSDLKYDTLSDKFKALLKGKRE
jgi:uncharacterized protein